MLNETGSINNRWDLLQQPAHPGQGMHAAYRTLLAAIDQGWLVESITHMASPLRMEMGYYLFVLNRAEMDQTRNIMVPALQEIEAFIRDNHFTVK